MYEIKTCVLVNGYILSTTMTYLNVTVFDFSIADPDLKEDDLNVFKCVKKLLFQKPIMIFCRKAVDFYFF